MRSTFLLPLRCGPHATGSWTKQLAGALRTAASIDPLSRVLWLMVGGLGSGTPQDSLTPDLITLLASAYDCTPEEAPCLDVVPLAGAAGWKLEAAATQEGVTSLLLPPGEEEATRLIREARQKAGLAELPERAVVVGGGDAAPTTSAEGAAGAKVNEAQLKQDPRPDIVAEIQIKVKDFYANTLVDTGCCTSCISETELQKQPFLHTFQFTPKTQVGHSINGSDVITVGLLRLHFEIGGTKFATNMRVMRGLVRPVVLGWDFLVNNKAILNLENSTLTIGTTTVPFLRKDRFTTPPHLTAFETTVIPPYSRMPVQSSLHADLDFIELHGSCTVLSQPFVNYSPVEGVVVGRSLSSIDLGLTYCEVLNTLPTPAVIKKGTPLATFDFPSDTYLKFLPFCIC